MFFIFGLSLGFSQTINPFGSYSNYYGNVSVWIKDTCYFEIYKTANLNNEEEKEIIPYHSSPIGSYEILSTGIVKIDSPIIKLKDTLTNEEIILYYLSNEKLFVKNGNRILANKDTLFVTQKLSANSLNGKRNLKYIGHWKFGKKDGNWLFFFGSDSITYVLYKNGIIINTPRSRTNPFVRDAKNPKTQPTTR